ncbi:MAG: ATP-binding cassette domain-containing protein [Spirochaetes bacterium]|nr:ATP-binding cassette domain-containing protein [Spirochaetota bacterium]
MKEKLLEVKDLKVYYPKYKGIFKKLAYHIKAVNGVSFSIKEGSTLSLVGESGCGKTTIGKAIISLVPVTHGSIVYDGDDITNIPEEGRKKIAQNIQIIFQDPYGSLNPKMKIGYILDEAVRVKYPGLSRARTAEKTVKLLEKIGLYSNDYDKYPHEFSGGQRQRIGIARAIAVEPKCIICDESVSALDVSIQADIINLLVDLQREEKLTYLFIAHDLSVVKYISTDVAVMYLGRIVEYGSSDQIFKTPLHPYTISLMSAVPEVESKKKKRRIILAGDVPSPVKTPSGCPFHPRCYMKREECERIELKFEEIGKGHYTACPFNRGVK